jgi:hypothetical protein
MQLATSHILQGNASRHGQPKLPGQLRKALQSRHYSHRTEQTYDHWVWRYIHFHNVRYPAGMGKLQINAFLTYLADGCGSGPLPVALDRKYPNSPKEWRWQWVFPQENRWKNPKTCEEGRHHINGSLVHKAVRAAVSSAELTKRVTCHTFRRSFATYLFERGYDIRTVQELLDYADVKVTMIYTHVFNRGASGVRSPEGCEKEVLMPTRIIHRAKSKVKRQGTEKRRLIAPLRSFQKESYTGPSN